MPPYQLVQLDGGVHCTLHPVNVRISNHIELMTSPTHPASYCSNSVKPCGLFRSFETRELKQSIGKFQKRCAAMLCSSSVHEFCCYSLGKIMHCFGLGSLITLFLLILGATWNFSWIPNGVAWARSLGKTLIEVMRAKQLRRR